MTLQVGEIIADKYRIVRLLGKGGMGEVYEGENLRIRRRVAIKTLLSAVSQKPDVVQRFEREAQAAGRIGSEHIVEVLDLGDLADGSRYMVMEFLEGSTLSDRIISRGRIPSREAARIVIELLEGLGAAHNAQIIHRDLKPANVFLIATKQGRADFVKILDFGVSKFSVLSDEMSMTSTGAVVGTPYYMSPEQAKGAKFIDARSDLYSVGVILYETITGQVPFNAQTFNELIFKIALETPPPPESFVPDLDPRVAAMIRRAMARDSAERFQSAAEFKQTLEAWCADFDRGVAPGPAAAVAAGWPAHPGAGRPPPGYAQQGALPRGGTLIQNPVAQVPGQPAPRMGGTEMMAAPGMGGQPGAHVVTAQSPRVAEGKKSTVLPILVASGILGFGAVAIGAAFLFKSHRASAESAASASATARPSATASSVQAATTTSAPTQPSAAPTAPPSASIVVLDDTGEPAAPAPTTPVVATHPIEPPHTTTGGGALVPPPHPTTQPTGKPGGRSITGDL